MKLKDYVTRRRGNSFAFWAFKLGLAVVFLVGLTLFTGFHSTAFTGFPKGYDAFNHLSLAQIIKENFPEVLWNPYWDEGVVLFPRNYPPLFHFGVGLIAKFFSLEVALVAQAVLALSIILTAIFTFLTILILTKRVLAGLFAGLFFLTSSTVWCYVLVDGLYPRVLSMMTVSLVIFGLVWDKTNRSYKSNRSDRRELKFAITILALVLAWLTHFLSAFLALAFVLVSLLFQPESWQEKFKQGLKIFLPVLGLTGFYYLPVMVLRPGRLGLLAGVGGGEYEPWEFLSLFKQGYPGLPFLSVPLGLLVMVLVFLLRHEIARKLDAKNAKHEMGRKLVYRMFFVFGFLSLVCLLYVLGVYKFTFYGIYPDQFLLPSVLFLALFLGLGLGFLGQLGVIRGVVLFLLISGLTAMCLLQAEQLKKVVIDQERYYPKLVFSGIEESRLFRFGHRNEILGGAFNFYSQTLQTRGYYEPGLLHPDYHHWFEEAVFMTAGNAQETKFLLDWFGVKSFYTSNRDLKGSGLGAVQAKFTQGEGFDHVGSQEYEYQKAQPILVATKAPVIIVRGKKKYDELLMDLAKKGIGSQKLIPILSRGAGPEDFSTQVKREIETETEKEIGGKAEFVNSHRRVIELEEGFTGVLLKESNFRNWGARMGQMEGEKWKMENLRIYHAGPGMMYVALPKDYKLPARVVFEYQLGWAERLGIGMSLLTLVGMILRKRISKI